jgi:outer membrane protein assembly factor BamB
MARRHKKRTGTNFIILSAFVLVIMIVVVAGLPFAFRNGFNTNPFLKTNSLFYYCGMAVSEQQYNLLNSTGFYQFEGNPCHEYYMNGTVGTFNITLDAGIDGPVTLYNNVLLVPLENPTYNYSPPSYYPPDMSMMWGGLASVNATTGAVIWEDRFNDSVMTQPLVINGIAYVGSGDDYVNPNVTQNGVFAVNISDGQIVWNMSTIAENMPTFVYYNNSIIKVGGWSPKGVDTKYVQALDPLTGDLKWQVNVSAFSAMSSPVLVGNTIYFGEDSYRLSNRSSGVIYAVNLDTHEIVWSRRFPKLTDRATQDSTATIWNNTLVDGYAYTYNRTAPSQNRTINLTLVGVDLTNGSIKWKFNEGVGDNTPRSVLPAMTAYNGIVFSDTTEIGWLYALNISTGTPLWKFYTGPSLPNPQIIDGYVFAENQSGTVFILKMDGTLYKKINLGTPEDWCGSAEIAQIGDKVVFGGENGRLMVIPISNLLGSG